MDDIHFNIIESKFPSLKRRADVNSEGTIYDLEREELIEVVTFLKNESTLFFDVLSCISGIDLGEEEVKLCVRYDFFSITKNLKIALVVPVKSKAKHGLSESVPSLCDLFKTANWLEREVYDLFGIPFDNHPDLRRILLPADWEAYPLRKTYSTPDKYHGLTVDHEDVIKKNDEQKDQG